MNGNMLKRIAIITTVIAVVSLSIAVVIGVASGGFRGGLQFNGLRFNFNKAGHVGSVAIDERKSILGAGINHIAVYSTSENITIREGSKEYVTTWFHGGISSADRPHLQVNRRGDTVEIRIEHPQHRLFGPMYYDAVLEVGIPRQYAVNLTAESVSGDIVLRSHDYSTMTLKTVSGDIQTDATIGVTGDVDANSISGDVALSFTNMPSRIEIEAVSGDIDLAMPSNAEFALDAHSTSGDVSCDFPIALTNSQRGDSEHSLVGMVGSGESAVTAGTVSGDIEITRTGGI